MNRRREIQLTPEEQEAFLRTTRKAALSTLDPDGFPHVVAMSFLPKDGAIYMTSYAKAQKVLNIQRYPQVGVLIETGQHYAEFRGVMIRGHGEIIADTAVVEAIMRENAARDVHTEASTRQTEGAGISRAPKRVVLKIIPKKVVTWDHTKLGGRY